MCVEDDIQINVFPMQHHQLSLRNVKYAVILLKKHIVLKNVEGSIKKELLVINCGMINI
jgi:hypothetical protein